MLFSDLMWDAVGCGNEADREALEEIENWEDVDWEAVEKEIEESIEYER